MITELFARTEHIFRPLLAQLPPKIAIRLFTLGRKLFLSQFVKEKPPFYTPSNKDSSVFWDIRFRSKIFNAAGMFKNGDGYETVARQGAGAFLAGTTTAVPRVGNQKFRIHSPFASYPQSCAASNWLGLPNLGHATVAKCLSNLERVAGCPIGASVSASPEFSGLTALEGLVYGMNLYAKANVDFIEMNESCPNTEAGKASVKELLERLEYVSQHFLAKRSRNIPVIVKFSTDTALSQLPELLDVLSLLNFDGVNFGNTSTNYSKYRNSILSSEQKLFDYFTANFGGGISGLPLSANSLALASESVKYLKNQSLKQEFHVIRTGGISSLQDLEASKKAGIALNQWYTGYFDQFAAHGHSLYQELLEQ